jgi:3-deoxy-manno-octulosonate cytidylyltransferase (CMP-KDO synthetase)
MRLYSIAVIPARYASERLLGKPLRLLGGKPLIQRVYESVVATELFSKVCVTTDDERIREAVHNFGGEVLMTSESCNSGTERIIELRNSLNADVIINVQGDEPFINKVTLEKLVNCFEKDPTISIASLMKKTRTYEEVTNPNVVKVVTDLYHFALYFSRSLIPYDRSVSTLIEQSFYAHIGVYGFRKSVLEIIANLKNGELERREKLEQLRWLENGLKIKMIETDYPGFGIDTEQDLARAEDMLKGLF